VGYLRYVLIILVLYGLVKGYYYVFSKLLVLCPCYILAASVEWGGTMAPRRRTMDRLAELRERRALTLRELAGISGVAADTINQIELGHRKARPSTLRKLAKALEVEVRELFEEPVPLGEAPSASPSPDVGTVEAGQTREDSLEFLHECESRFNDIGEKLRGELVATDPHDRQALNTLFAQAMFAYLGAEEFVKDLDPQGRAGRRVIAAVERIHTIAELAYAALSAEAKTEGGAVTAIADYQRRRKAAERIAEDAGAEAG
jgi:transcriptional regulator with XRE-family HTH domain